MEWIIDSTSPGTTHRANIDGLAYGVAFIRERHMPYVGPHHNIHSGYDYYGACYIGDDLSLLYYWEAIETAGGTCDTIEKAKKRCERYHKLNVLR